MFATRKSRNTVAALVGGLALMGQMSGARAESPFPRWVGSWSGTGQVHLEQGKSEQITCRALLQYERSRLGPGARHPLRLERLQDRNARHAEPAGRTRNRPMGRAHIQRGGRRQRARDGFEPQPCHQWRRYRNDVGDGQRRRAAYRDQDRWHRPLGRIHKPGAKLTTRPRTRRYVNPAFPLRARCTGSAPCLALAA